MPSPVMSIGARLARRSREVVCLRKGATGPCVVWTGDAVRSGYGRMGFTEPGSRTVRKRLTHRVAYELYVGPIPEGYEVDHLCLVPACWNPMHLEAVTPEENMRRRYARKTHCNRGHLLSGANLYVNAADGARICRTCQRKRGTEWMRQKRARTA